MAAPYDVKFAPAAKRDILAMENKAQKDIIKMIETLAMNPRPPGARKLEGLTGLLIHPLNGFRLIYKVEDQAIFVLRIH